MARYKRNNKQKVVTVDWSMIRKKILVAVKKFFCPLLKLVFKVFNKRYYVTEVLGNSMSPAFLDSELVIVDKTVKNILIGDVVLFKHSYADYCLIKRVINVYKDSYFVQGDNPNESIDSRHFGAINRENIIGRVIL